MFGHRHRDLVELGNEVAVVAASFDRSDPYARTDPCDFGLYFDRRWKPPWPHEHVAWRDFGTPDADVLAAALRGVLGRVRAGEVVEIGCLGGHGRTGTALACLAVMTGTPAAEAVERIRRDYCSHAVETRKQAAFVASFAVK